MYKKRTKGFQCQCPTISVVAAQQQCGVFSRLRLALFIYSHCICKVQAWEAAEEGSVIPSESKVHPSAATPSSAVPHASTVCEDKLAIRPRTLGIWQATYGEEFRWKRNSASCSRRRLMITNNKKKRSLAVQTVC